MPRASGMLFRWAAYSPKTEYAIAIPRLLRSTAGRKRRHASRWIPAIRTLASAKTGIARVSIRMSGPNRSFSDSIRFRSSSLVNHVANRCPHFRAIANPAAAPSESPSHAARVPSHFPSCPPASVITTLLGMGRKMSVDSRPTTSPAVAIGGGGSLRTSSSHP